MSLTAPLVYPIILCDSHTQESGLASVGHRGAAFSPCRVAGRVALGGGSAAGSCGRAAPHLWEAGMPVRPRRTARALCVSAGSGAFDVCALGVSAGGSLPGGDFASVPGCAGGDFPDQCGAAVPAGVGLADDDHLRAGAAHRGGRCVGGDGRLAGQHGRVRAGCRHGRRQERRRRRRAGQCGGGGRG
jgi:hypothetical protein